MYLSVKECIFMQTNLIFSIVSRQWTVTPFILPNLLFTIILLLSLSAPCTL